MSLSKVVRTAGGGGTTSWYLKIDSGATSDIAPSESHVSIAANDTYVWVAQPVSRGGEYGRTYDHAYIGKFDMEGGLEWEKVLGSASDTKDMPYGGSQWVYWDKMHVDPDTTDQIITTTQDTVSASYVAQISADGATLVEASGTGAPAYNGIGLLSNGDVVTEASGFFVHDKSASPPYTSTTRWGVTGHGNSYFFTVSDSDEIISTSRDSPTPRRVTLLTMNSSGTLQHQRKLYVLNDSGDDCDPWGICTDADENVYLAWQQLDSSAGTSEYYVSKLNSSLGLQWTRKSPDNWGSKKRGKLVISPSGNNIYWAPEILGSACPVYILTINGTSLAKLQIEEGSTLDILNATIEVNSNSVFVAGHYENASNIEVGIMMGRFTQSQFENGYSVGDLDINKFGSTWTSKSVSQETTGQSTSGNSSSLSETSDLEFVALDTATTKTLVTD